MDIKEMHTYMHMHSLSTLCLLSMRHDAWQGLDPHVRCCLYPGVVQLQMLLKQWLRRRRMQMEAVESLVDLLGGMDLKPEGTDDGHEVTDVWALRAGDHVIISKKGLVYHHGIFIGDIEGHSRPCFADMGREDKHEEPKLRIVEYPVFMRGYSTYFIVSYNMSDTNKEATARDKAVDMAIKLVACPVSRVLNKYDVLKRNCECFAWFCKTGGLKQTSDQVEAIMRLVQKDLVRKESVLLTAIHGGSLFISGLCSS